MKTAEEWWEQFRKPNTQVAIVTYPDIKNIQADALLYAAEGIGKWLTTLPKNDAYMIAIREAQIMIRAEAEKLDGIDSYDVTT
jgi:hypothetical protein